MTLISAVWPWPLLYIVLIAAVGLLVWDTHRWQRDPKTIASKAALRARHAMEEERRAIERGEASARAGRVTPLSEVMKRLRKEAGECLGSFSI